MRKVSKNRVDDDIVSSTNGSVKDDEQADEAGGDPDYDDDRDKEDANGGGGSEHDDDDDAPLDSTSSKTKTPKKSKKSKTPKSKSKKAKKSKKPAKKAKNEYDTKDDASEDEENEEEEEYEVEKVVGSKKVKGKTHYLIRWKGYSASSDTWEPEDTLSCPDAIKKFKEEGNDEEESTPPPSKRGRKRKPGKAKKEKPSKPAKRPKTDWDSENADENAEYEVERILEVHHKKSGAREFLIHWKGWSTKFDSWEPEEHLNCTEMIEKFMTKVEKAKSSDSRSLRVNPESTNRYTLQAPSTGRRLSKRRGQHQRVRYDDAE